MTVRGACVKRMIFHSRAPRDHYHKSRAPIFAASPKVEKEKFRLFSFSTRFTFTVLLNFFFSSFFSDFFSVFFLLILEWFQVRFGGAWAVSSGGRNRLLSSKSRHAQRLIQSTHSRLMQIFPTSSCRRHTTTLTVETYG